MTTIEVNDFSLESATKAHVLKIVRECDGNFTRAAAILGISKRTLFNMRRRWGITAAPMMWDSPRRADLFRSLQRANDKIMILETQIKSLQSELEKHGSKATL